ncbi:MAG: glycoside hydrolase, partial [Candidatus Omnitrophota bacterium]
MSDSPTKVILLWHMHQPSYKHPTKSHYYILPWVRLHGVKDYYGMAKLVEKFDKVRVSFNFSGVLLEQIFDYVKNRAQDYYLTLSLKSPSQLTA